MSDLSLYLESITQSYYQELGLPFVSKKPMLEKSTKTALIVSPHPDDECINGGLALRLKQELGYQIINVPFTLGSKQERRASRHEELKRACKILNFTLTEPLEEGREEKDLVKLLDHHRPQVVITSHNQDRHATHIRCSEIVMKALQQISVNPYLAFHEFWQAQTSPNLLVEFDYTVVKELMLALSEHRGEIERNPYHLRLPFWLADNTRRGSELVGGTSISSSQILYSGIYRVMKMEGKKMRDLPHQILAREHSLKTLFI